MFRNREVKVFLVHLLSALALWPQQHDCLIITSVLAGDKKFKTISFDTKFLKPLTFEKEMPLTEFRRHRTFRPPKFDIDVNIPIKLPLEDEYAKEEPKKPVVSNLFFQTGEIVEPAYGKQQKGYLSKKMNYKDELAYASSNIQNQRALTPRNIAGALESGNRLVQPNVAQAASQQMIGNPLILPKEQISNPRSDVKETQEIGQQEMMAQAQDLTPDMDYSRKSYAQPAPNYQGDYQQQEFIPGGFVNLQLSGPTGGPKMTYEDYDREKWAQQLSQAPGAMPYPILNYQQLQNFYGGLGTFTNGLAENRYAPTGLLDKLKSGLHHFANKFHFG